MNVGDDGSGLRTAGASSPESMIPSPLTSTKEQSLVASYGHGAH